jgi:hypothetical protein
LQWCQSGGSPSELAESLGPLIEAYLDGGDPTPICDGIAASLAAEGFLAEQAKGPRLPPPPGVDALETSAATKASGVSCSQASTTIVHRKGQSDGCDEIDDADRAGDGDEDVAEDNEDEEGDDALMDLATTSAAPVSTTTDYFDDAQQQAELDDLDDFASAWQECRATGRRWGGRGFGGRGVARTYQVRGRPPLRERERERVREKDDACACACRCRPCPTPALCDAHAASLKRTAPDDVGSEKKKEVIRSPLSR